MRVVELFPQLEILDLVREDEWGAVYHARQPRSKRLVLLRVLPAEQSRDRAFVERFARAARALAKVRHPHLMAIQEIGTDGVCSLQMESVEGTRLRDALHGQPLPPHSVPAVAAQLCGALEHAHREGVVHGRLSSDCIVLDVQGRARIADLGLASLISGEPDQPQSDISALGRVLYEILTGTLLQGDALPIPDHGLDRRWRTVLERCWGHGSHPRYQRVSEILTDIPPIDNASRREAAASRVLSPARRRRVALIAAALLVAVVYSYLVIPAARQIWREFRWSRTQAARARPPRSISRFNVAATQPPQTGILTAEGPQLTTADAAKLGLQPEQLRQVNAVLQVSWRQYLELERRHWNQRQEDGRSVTDVAPFREEFQQFAEYAWSKLDRILAEQQQAIAHQQLPLGRELPASAAEPAGRARPGWFGWDGAAARIEIRFEGGLYLWTASAHGQTIAESGPQLPIAWERFLAPQSTLP